MFSQRLTTLTPYVPGEQPQDRSYIKLNTNENPYPPSPRIAHYLKSLDSGVLRRYPDPKFTVLRARIAARYGVTPGQVFAGNGSDEVLSFVFFAFFDSTENGPLRFPEHSYSFYPVYCNYYGIAAKRIPLTADYRIDLAPYPLGPSCGVIFPNPNAPTGIALPLADIAAFLRRYPADRVVVVDEAYVDFGAESAVSLIDAHPNLLVVRTLSKSMSLAGLRLGFAMGNQRLIDALYTTKDAFNSYPLGTLSQQVGSLAMDDTDYYDRITRAVMDTRERFSADVTALGWDVLPSAANFVFARRPGVSGKTVYQRLKENGILVRHFETPGISDFVRITIGTDADMAACTAAMSEAF
ncbi:MAG: histidinol-phosphate transaminase [Pseudomonadota bacterium]